MDARQWPVREERLLTVQHYCESSKSLEGDRGKDRVRRSLIPMGSQLIKCVGEEESLVSTALHFKLDPKYSSGSGLHRTLSHHAQMDDIISCQVSICSCWFLMAMASSRSIRFEEAQS